MWIFSKYGFYSVVRLRRDDAEAMRLPKPDNYVMVRARVREDMETLVDLMKSTEIVHRKPDIHEWKGRDYPYRIVITRDQWVDTIADIAFLIDYTNFKDTVKAIQGAGRALLYSKVWQVMNAAERFLGVKQRNVGVYDYDPDQHLIDYVEDIHAN